MIKVITGYVEIALEEQMEEISEIVNSPLHNCSVVEEEEDCIVVDDLSPELSQELFDKGFISHGDFIELGECDRIKFYSAPYDENNLP